MPVVKKLRLTERQKRKLNKIYYDVSNPASYGGINRLSKETQIHPALVTKWLNKQWSYVLHKPARKRFPTRRYVTRGLNHQWQMDLIDMQKYSRENAGYRYILLAIDIFSRQAYAEPVKSKRGFEIAQAIERIFLENDVNPLLLQTDRGLEFYNSSVDSMLKKYNVELFSVNSVYKASHAERLIRTLKERLFRVFTRQSSYRWLEILPDVIKAYNNSYHRGLKHVPSKVTKTNEADIWIKQYSDLVKATKTKFKIGDKVRISKYKGIFFKGYLQNWTDEVFIVSEVNTKYKPPMYKLKDYDGTEIEGRFYEYELSKSDIEEFRIEKILRKKTSNGKTMALVKWFGYKEPSWINYDNIHSI